MELWDNRDDVTLTAYLHSNSKEYSADKKRPAVIICPGGGYVVTAEREAEPVAMKFAAAGYQAFVLRYSTYFGEGIVDLSKPPVINENVVYPKPLFDLAKAVMVLREKSDQWLVDSENIVVCGFSAGGHLAASLGVHWKSDLLKAELGVESEVLKPNLLILGYPLLDFQLTRSTAETATNKFTEKFRVTSNVAVFKQPEPDDETFEQANVIPWVSQDTPATFLWHTADDSKVTARNSLLFATELSNNEVPFELHVFESGVHASSLCDETSAGNSTHINPHCQIWFELALKWLKKHNCSLSL